MKKSVISSLKVFLLFSIILISTGCMKTSVQMEINKDKSMNLSIIEVVEKNSIEKLSDIIDDDKIKEYENNGFYIQKYSEDSKVGYQMTKTIQNIDSVSSEFVLDGTATMDALLGKDKQIFTIEKGFFKNKYIANFNVSKIMKYNEDDDNTTEQILKENITSDASIEFEVKLPYKPINDNATNVSNNGTKLLWDLTKVSDISFEFELYNMTNIYIAGGAGILVIVLIVMGIIKLISGKPKGNFKPTYNSSFNQQSTVNQEFDNQQNEFVDNEINNDLVVNDNLQSNPSFIIQNDNSVNEEDVNPEPAFVQPGFIATPNTQVTDAQVVSEPTDNNLVEELSKENLILPVVEMDELEQTPVNQELDQKENIKIEEQQMPSIEMPALNSEVTTNESNVNSFVPTQTVLEQQPLPNIEIPALNSNATPVDNQQPEPITFQQPTSTIDIPSAVDENIEPTVEFNLNDSKEFQNKLEESKTTTSFDIPMSVEVPQINNNAVEQSVLSNVELPSPVDEEIEPTIEFNLADEPEIKQALEQQVLPDIDIPVTNEPTQSVENNIQNQNTFMSDEIPIPTENIINNNQ